ncbi:type II toxin-antitoxin system RelE/ParE family toxin, partial [Kingella kingae]|uniref:type II toxin-antitoxin system RelE/ParE family toxin n=1 Tax=Kingella kingae TaxID=504 RepID=UPI003D6FC4CE
MYEINNHIENIKQMPKMYAVYGNIPTYRKFVVKRKYTVFYVIDEDRQVVIIAHIFPSMRDLSNFCLLYTS